MAYDPSSRTISKVLYHVFNANNPWFIPTVRQGDEPDAGTKAQRLAQCDVMVGSSLGQTVEA